MKQTAIDIASAARSDEDAPRLHPPREVDNETWLLTNRLENLHRMSEALLDMAAATQPAGAVVTLTPDGLAPPAGGTVAPSQAAPAEAHPHWPARPEPDAPLRPPTGAAFLTDGFKAIACRAFDVTGLTGRDLAAAIRRVRDMQGTSRDFAPVFLTDSTEVQAISSRGYVAEYLPAWDAADPARLDARRAHVLRKWGARGFEDLRSVRAAPAPAPAPRPAANAPSSPGTPARKPKALVVCWDLGHNPVGRGMVIYDLLAQDWDVELVGPLWSRFGGRVWGPIDQSGRKVRGFPCETFEDFWPAAQAYAAAVRTELVVVCKPRLPALALGALIKATTGCPLVLDIDDFELSFFKDETAATLDDLSSAGADALVEPYAELATRTCETLTAAADSIIVSNAALRARYGGTIVRHARDEAQFDLARFDRAAERASMGMAPEDFSIVFVGTARPHKGVYDIARTLGAFEDRRFVFHLVGDITDRRVRNQLDSYGARIVYHPNCAFEALPSRLAAADAVVLLQDAAHPISQYQIPAKISDASALGLTILATDVPPLRDLAAQGVVRTITADQLGEALTGLIAERDRTGTQWNRSVREAFEGELGNAVNRQRLDQAIRRARSAPKALPAPLADLLALCDRTYRGQRAARYGAAPAPKVKARARPPLDIAMFWKQNDTGMFGRRSDKLMRALLDSGRFGRVLQFDAPIEVMQLALSAEVPAGSQGATILRHAIDNQAALRDRDDFRLRTFLWSRHGRAAQMPPVHASLDDYPAYVERQMADWGMRPETTLAWVCPVVFDFPAVRRRIPFRGVVGDLIDDQRDFEMSPAYRERIVASYVDTVPLFDLGFTNCAAQVAAFSDLNERIEIVPNGTDLHPEAAGAVPEALDRIAGPIAGYVGNLRDRFHWELLAETARAMPDVTFAVVGGGARDRDVVHLDGIENVVMPGIVPAETVPAVIRRFDVALMPHRVDAQTERMNPLKIYQYFAARKPIVATGVSNIDDGIRPYIRFADTAPAFADAIRAALAGGDRFDAGYDAVLDGISWPARSARILEHLDRAGLGR